MKLDIIKYASGKIGLEIIGETDFETKIIDAHWDNMEPSRGKGNSVLDSGRIMGFFLNLIPAPQEGAKNGRR